MHNRKGLRKIQNFTLIALVKNLKPDELFPNDGK